MNIPKLVKIVDISPKERAAINLAFSTNDAPALASWDVALTRRSLAEAPYELWKYNLSISEDEDLRAREVIASVLKSKASV